MRPMQYTSPYLKISRADNLRFSSKYREVVGSAGTGALKPDANGYYTTILGALNINTSGAFQRPYLYPESKHAFADESVLKRKIAHGTLTPEMDHPDRGLYKSEDAYNARLAIYKKERQCAHISEVWLDETGVVAKTLDPKTIWPGRSPVLIMGKVQPRGMFGHLLKAEFDNPDANVYFSMRTISRIREVNGREFYVLDLLTGFDWVTEGGLSISNSWLASSLPGQSHAITRRNVDSLVKQTTAKPGGAATIEHCDDYVSELVKIQCKIDAEPAQLDLRIRDTLY